MDTVIPETVGLSSSRLERIRSVMQELIDRGRFPAISTLVYRRGHVAWFASQGSPQLAGTEPLAPDAIFRIFSMTKPITVTATMMLWEQGLFGLHDPISAYIPGFADPQVLVDVVNGEPVARPAEREITIHDLLTHTSGLIYHFGDDALAQRYRDGGLGITPYDTETDLESFCDLLAPQPLAFSPGEKWQYGYSHDVLGRLVELISGQSFGEHLRDRIFEPLGMYDTSFGLEQTKLGRLVPLYAPDASGSLTVVDGIPNGDLRQQPAFHSGGAGLVSTMGDYLRFARVLLGHGGGQAGTIDGVRLLGRKTVALMTKNHLTPPQIPAYRADSRPGEGYGLGMGVTMDPSQVVTHSSARDFGWGGAASTWFRVDPKEEMIVLIMSQVIDGIDWVHAERFRTLAYSALM